MPRKNSLAILWKPNDLEMNWFAVRSPVTIIQIVEVARLAAIKLLAGAKSQVTIRAKRVAGSCEGTVLRRAIELKLEVGSNIPCTAMTILQNAVFECHHQGTRIASNACCV